MRPVTDRRRPAAAATRWSLPKRLALRCGAVYAVLFTFPFPLDQLPWIRSLVESLPERWRTVDAAIARLLGVAVPEDLSLNGSGDTPLDWVHLGATLAIAALAGAAWTALDRRRRDDDWLYGWLRVGLRYYLAMTMFFYGLAKVLGLQFPFPWAGRLIEPVGEMSPMGLLWTFMGYSASYSIVTGLAVVLGGALLLARRTTTLGALVLIGVMSNVVALDFSYDVPVKIAAVHLLAASILLAAGDARRLLAVLVLNRPAPAADLGVTAASPRRRRALLAVKLAFVALALYALLPRAWTAYHRFGRGAPRPALAGVWDVTALSRDGAAVPPLDTDTRRWRLLAIDPFGAIVRTMDGTDRRVDLAYDPAAATLTLIDEGRPPAVLAATRPDPDTLHLEGRLDDAATTVTLKRRHFVLETRGFHWVNEFPFNK